MNLQNDAQRIVQEGEAAKSAVLQYSDWLVTTINASIPDEQWHTPVPHPCALEVSDSSDTDDQNYVHQLGEHCTETHKMQSSILPPQEGW